MVRGLMTLYEQAGDKGKELIVAEFKKALTYMWEAFWAHKAAHNIPQKLALN
jgi:hypothetical protein